MIEVITAIALLCQVAPPTLRDRVIRYQENCHKQYLQCVRDRGAEWADYKSVYDKALTECILEKNYDRK